MTSIYIALVEVDDDSHISTKHNLTLQDVRDAVQWPAKARAALDHDENHGSRWLAMGTDSRGRDLIVWLAPVPRAFGEVAETWLLITAYPV